MDNDIKYKADSYFLLTEEIKDCLLKDEFEMLDELFNKRQTIIDSVKDISYSAKALAKCINEANLSKLEEEISSLMEDKKSKIKASMEELLASKNANMKYKSRFTVDPIFFNKKI